MTKNNNGCIPYKFVELRLISYIKNSPSLGNLKYRVTFVLLYPLIKVFPRFRKYICNKMWNMYKKSLNDIV